MNRSLAPLSALLAALLIIGRDAIPSGPDQCLRREIFQQCVKSLPAGPQATKYNDWDEAVSQCESVAYYQSLKRKSHIKPECDR